MGIFRSSIGKKVLMAISGIILFGFLVGHMLGNLQIFIGADAINEYARVLHSIPGVLYPIRGFLLLTLIVHVLTAIQLQKLNRDARPVAYKVEDTAVASVSSRYMFHTGLIIAAFIIMHLLHFTVRLLQPEYAGLMDAQGRDDVYSILVLGFQNHYYAAAYVLCLLILGSHLIHAVVSFFQTLGFNHPVYNLWIKKGAVVVVGLLVLGYLSVPLSVVFGLLTLPQGVLS